MHSMNIWIDQKNNSSIMKGLFLDDERSPLEVFWEKYPPNVEWVIVRTPQDFLRQIITAGKTFDIISFDHDLQSYDEVSKYDVTGYDLLKKYIDWAIINIDQLPEIVFHTQNCVGRHNMMLYLEFAKCKMFS